jgi:5-methylcytosine-specific restriction protein A
MPVAAPRPCRHVGCRALVYGREGFCDAHRKARYREYSQQRQAKGERVKLYDTAAWKRVRATHLALEPLCRSCRLAGRLVAANVVDHITPIKKGGSELDDSNLQSLCKPCHSAKTLIETMSGGGG